MKRLLVALVSLLTLGSNLNAQVVISSISTVYTQNFDGLSNDTTWATAHAMSLTGWAIYERGTSSAVDQMYKVSNGSRNNGETYSYGDTLTTTSTDRALGSVSSGTNLPSFGVMIKNSTGGNITGLHITYRGEEWRSGDTTVANLDSLVFEYSTTATGINDSNASWNPLPALMLTTPNLTTNVAGALNGNAAGNYTNITGDISALVANNNTIALRWRDINKAGGDDGLAIDDLNISFSSTGNPKPSIVSTNPADNATLVSPSLSSLTMTFDQSVTAGTGNITIKNLTDATAQTIACASATIAGAVVTIPGVTLTAGKDYAVNFDSTCFHNITAANSYGIYDNTTWNFSTQPSGILDYSRLDITMMFTEDQRLLMDIPESGLYTIQWMDLQGRVLAQQAYNLSAGRQSMPCIMSLSEGLYLIQASQNTHRGVLKVMMHH